MRNDRNSVGLDRLVTAICLVAAPLGLVAQELIAPEPGGERTASDVLAAISAQPERYELAILFNILSAILLIPALTGLAQVIGGRGRVLARVGGALGVVGAIGLACQNAFNLASLGLATGDDRVRMAALYDEIRSVALAGFIEVIFIAGILLSLIFLASAGWRSRRLPRGAAAMVLAFVVLDIVTAGQAKVLDVSVHLLLAVGLGWIGVAMLREGAPARDGARVPTVPLAVQ